MYEPTAILNPPMFHEPERTFVVFGHFRGGTSMVAGVLRIFGIHFGDKLGSGNNEDLEFQEATPERIVELAAIRDSQHEVWGWKYPGVHAAGPGWVDALRNPRFVVIFRDILAASQGEMWRGGATNFMEELRKKQEQQDNMLRFIDEVDARGYPIAMISYDRVISNPERLVDTLATFSGLRIDSRTRERALEYIMPERGHGEPSVPPATREALHACVASSALRETAIGK